ncbi:MAG: hypothetical protein NZ853_04420 [Leptospiraceae bacterium]|nr:hypothetical protein [Leptospiraceae bacterium]MDW7975419.1 hypothetical protein [Leptospiraceae bacterium]
MNYYLDYIQKALSSQQRDQIEYLLHHILEVEPNYGNYLMSEYYTYFRKDLEKAKKHLFKLIWKNKKDYHLKIHYLQLLFLNQEYPKALKWLQRYLPYLDKQTKSHVYYILSWIYFLQNKPERSIQCINFCLRIASNYLPAIYLREIIHQKYGQSETDI